MIELNKIYNEDCLLGMQRIPDKSVDLVLTDPPYKIITGGNPNDKHRRPKGILESNKNLFTHHTVDAETYLQSLFRVLKDGSHCYVFSNTNTITEMLVSAQKVGFKLHNLLVWQKNNCTPSQWYMKNCEYVLFLRKGKATYINNIGSKTVHQFDNILGNKTHPTEKPVDLIEHYIKNSSDVFDTVLDPFMGSGTTAIACMNTGRNFIGFELDVEYHRIACERIEKELLKNG